MSGGSEHSEAGADARPTGRSQGATRRAALGDAVERSSVRAAATLVGLGCVAAVVGRRVVANAPVDLPGAAALGTPTAETAVLVVLGVAVVARGLVDAAPLAEVGLVAAGVFGAFAGVSTAARLPAAVATLAGAGLVVAARVGRDARSADAAAATPLDYAAVRRAVPAALLLAGLALSLSTALGVLPVSVRPPAVTVSLLGVAATPLLAPSPDRHRWVAWSVAGLVAGGVVVVGLAAPYVSGAVLLVAFAVVGSSLPVVALALGGATLTAVSGLLAGRYEVAAGALALGLAGVPATEFRALAVVFGLAVLLDARGDPALDGRTADASRDGPGGESA
jgi:hypothetical protein